MVPSLLYITNNSIKQQLRVYAQLKGRTILFVAIKFDISYALFV